MSVTSGFFNSFNGDRKYYAEEVSAIFDGVINDGIFANIGTAFVVKANGGMEIAVGVGRAWFNSAWILNDAVLPFSIEQSEILISRIDAVVIEIDHSDGVRAGSIKVVKGDPSSTPVRPTLIKTKEVNQYPLAYIHVGPDVTEITQADITNMVGTEETPFVTGILQTISLDELLGQWQSELDQFVDNESAEIDEYIEQRTTDLDSWIDQEQTDFNEWFGNLETQLSGDVAGNLQVQIDQVKREIKSSIIYITLYADNWVGEESFTQTVDIDGITANSKIDLQPDAIIFNQLFEDGVAVLYIENNEGVITAYSIDGKPTVDITIQATVTDAYIATDDDVNVTYSDGNLSIT